MSDNQEFKFDEDDGFPETDLSAAFEDSEHTAPAGEEMPDKSKKKKKKNKKMSSGGSSKSRVVLLLILLIVAGAGGAYYFMDLGGTSTEPPKAPPRPTQSVAVPQPVKVPPPRPVPAPTPVDVPAVKDAAPAVSEDAVKPAAETVAAPAASATVQAPAKADQGKTPEAKDAATAVEPPKSAVEEKAAVEMPSAEVQKPVAAEPVKATAPPVATAGLYTLDAGAYMMEANRKALIQKIRDFGYTPIVEPVNATVTLVRIRLGTFPQAEVEEALDFVRPLAPGAFSLRSGDQFVVYAGSFADAGNAARLKEKLLAEGVTAEDEPIEVQKTLSRVRFGGFPDEASAAAAAEQAEAAGISVRVVKSP